MPIICLHLPCSVHKYYALHGLLSRFRVIHSFIHSFTPLPQGQLLRGCRILPDLRAHLFTHELTWMIITGDLELI